MVDDLNNEFVRTFMPHMDSAFALARWITGNPQDAEDVVQEAYLRAFRAYERYTDDNSLAWLMTIVRNTSYSWLRRYYPARETAVFDEALHSDGAVPISSTFRLPEQQLYEQLERSQWRDALDKLPVAYREVIALHEIQGLPYRTVADVVGVPIGTVMSRLSRARRHLQQLLLNTKSREQTPCNANKSDS